MVVAKVAMEAAKAAAKLLKKPSIMVDDTKKFVVKNLQVQDAVNMSLLKKLRDTANAAGEQLGKNDIFAVVINKNSPYP